MKFFVAFMIASVALIAADSPDQTFGLKNGRFWNSLPTADTRHTFVMGLLDGWELRGHTEDAALGRVLTAMKTSSHFTMKDLSEMVTSVYSDIENLSLPIGWVVMGCFAVQRGDTTRDAVFMSLRKYLGTLSGRMDAVPITETDPTRLINGLAAVNGVK